MAVSPTTTVDAELSNIFKRMFLSSKILAAFPFKLNGQNFSISPREMVYSLIALTAYGYMAGITGYRHLGGNNSLMMKLSLTMPHQTVFIILLINTIWLSFNIKTMSNVVESLQLIHPKIRVKLSFKHTYMRIFSVFVVVETITKCFYYGYDYFTEEQGTMIFVFLVTFAIVDQFASFLSVIRLFYDHICDKLNTQTAEQFVGIHDQLAHCCGLVNHCYSPQLLLVSLAAVVYNVSLLYIAISQFQVYGRFEVPYLLATFTFFLIVMHFTRACRLTKLQSENFNKLLYRLIINQDSRELMRNRRIMLHYKGTKELQFSAIGFINVDYPLICSMVSTATTYILILVQFSN